MKARISLCIPSRNNEKTISRCIASVFDVIDQLVVLDSGSTDCTLDVIKKFDAEIFHTRWKDHYADYFNELFSYAKYDYILFLQGNEYLCDSSKDPLRALLQIGNLSKKSAILFKRKDIDRFHSAAFMGREVTLGRIFDKHGGFWKFPVHEYFYHAGDAVNSNIVLFREHQRDAGSDKEERRKRGRILKEFLAAHPDLTGGEACRLHMLKATDHLALGEYSSAVEDYNQAIHYGEKAKTGETRLWYIRSLLGKGLAYYRMEDFDRAAGMFFITDDMPETIIEKYFFLGRIALSGGRREEAFNYFRIALNNRGYSDSCFFCVPFRILFHLLSDAEKTAALLRYTNKEEELRHQLEASFGNLLPRTDEVALFP